MQMLVQLLDALGAVVTFRNHFHFYLRTLHGVAFANHGAEHAVTAEVGVGGHEQVAQISRVVDGAFHRMYGVEQSVHFLDGVRDEYRLEVVAILQTVADAGSDGIDILQNRSIFDAHDVRIDRCLDIVSGKLLGEYLGLLPGFNILIFII